MVRGQREFGPGQKRTDSRGIHQEVKRSADHLALFGTLHASTLPPRPVIGRALRKHRSEQVGISLGCPLYDARPEPRGRRGIALHAIVFYPPVNTQVLEE